jgi:hypothetical protein
LTDVLDLRKEESTRSKNKAFCTGIVWLLPRLGRSLEKTSNLSLTRCESWFPNVSYLCVVVLRVLDLFNSRQMILMILPVKLLLRRFPYLPQNDLALRKLKHLLRRRHVQILYQRFLLI